MPENPVYDEETEKAPNNDPPANAVQEPSPLTKKNKSQTDTTSKGNCKAPKPSGVLSVNIIIMIISLKGPKVMWRKIICVNSKYSGTQWREQDEDDQDAIDKDVIGQDFECIQWQWDMLPVQPPTAFTGAPGQKSTH